MSNDAPLTTGSLRIMARGYVLALAVWHIPQSCKRCRELSLLIDARGYCVECALLVDVIRKESRL